MYIQIILLQPTFAQIHPHDLQLKYDIFYTGESGNSRCINVRLFQLYFLTSNRYNSLQALAIGNYHKYKILILW